jgi:hypothetical protein
MGNERLGNQRCESCGAISFQYTIDEGTIFLGGLGYNQRFLICTLRYRKPISGVKVIAALFSFFAPIGLFGTVAQGQFARLYVEME